MFEPALTKYWWNYQQDFWVLESTIAHMYQGTQRKPHLRTASSTARGKFMFTNKFLLGKRPASMEFSKGAKECELHQPGTNDMGTSCPCLEGHVDLASLLFHFCRQHGLKMPKLQWTSCRAGFKFGDLLKTVLGNDRLSPLLEFMKDCNHSSGLSTLEFYQSLGKPGMEKNDIAMAYQIGDVISLNRIVEQFTVLKEDPDFTAAQLIAYMNKDARVGNRPRRVPQRVSPLKSHLDIPLFEENPTRFRQDPYRTAFSAEAKNSLISDETLFNTASLQPWDHEIRAREIRKLTRSASSTLIQKELYEPLDRKQTFGSNTQKRNLLNGLTDPCKLSVPAVCGVVTPVDVPGPVVRAGETYIEALIEFLRSPQASEAAPPPGFGAPPGSVYGLALKYEAVPGESLPRAAETFEAFQQRGSHWPSFKAYNRPAPVRREIKVQPEKKASAKKIADEVMKKRPEYGEDWMQQVQRERDCYKATIKAEQEKNAMHGRPSSVDLGDVWDPEGREYRRRIRATPAWNRPPMPFVPNTYEDGSWKSAATVKLAALKEVYPDLDSSVIAAQQNQQGAQKSESKWSSKEFVPSSEPKANLLEQTQARKDSLMEGSQEVEDFEARGKKSGIRIRKIE